MQYTDEKLYNSCLIAAQNAIDSGMIMGDVSIGDAAHYFYTEEKTKLERETYVETHYLDYDDEVVSIEKVGEESLMDISVSGDNLFYANGILTKNSFGLPATADWMAAMVTNENLMELNQQLLIQLKTRYGAKKQSTKSQLVEVEFEKMRYKDLAQNVMEDKPVEDVKKTKAKFEKTKLDDWDIE
jgi:hypothetical protein